ncbi:hypothetical protein, partial [Escherichia coli]|uniref:hypothetical protein n=1 Tax=Escherichia coli TaxID=562 RepID=UPI001F4A4A08
YNGITKPIKSDNIKEALTIKFLVRGTIYTHPIYSSMPNIKKLTWQIKVAATYLNIGSFFYLPSLSV